MSGQADFIDRVREIRGEPSSISYLPSGLSMHYGTYDVAVSNRELRMNENAMARLVSVRVKNARKL